MANADISEISLAPPEGHQHLRASIHLHTGKEIILQEATVANLVRAFGAIKTHPKNKRIRLIGRELTDAEKKKGFANRQFLEEEN